LLLHKQARLTTVDIRFWLNK